MELGLIVWTGNSQEENKVKAGMMSQWYLPLSIIAQIQDPKSTQWKERADSCMWSLTSTQLGDAFLNTDSLTDRDLQGHNFIFHRFEFM